jgi:hypothetical protein
MRTAIPVTSLLFVAFTLNAQNIKTFDFPNASDTSPSAISSSGEIVGIYYDNTGGHAFLRDSKGKFKTFDDPNGFQTVPLAINSRLIVGNYLSNQLDPHGMQLQPGFIRDNKGAFSDVLPPSALAVFPTAISSSGVVVGWTVQTDFSRDSFIRSPDGTITLLTFGSVESQINAINPAGQTTGDYFPDPNSLDVIGFLREPDGSVTTFNVLDQSRTFPFAMNARGQIVGFSQDLATNTSHGFLRDVDGTITIIDYPGAISTGVFGIDSRGRVAGNYSISPSEVGVFVREVDGTFTNIEVPPSQFTSVSGMNPQGEIVGTFGDENLRIHGWLLEPKHDNKP